MVDKRSVMSKVPAIISATHVLMTFCESALTALANRIVKPSTSPNPAAGQSSDRTHSSIVIGSPDDGDYTVLPPADADREARKKGTSFVPIAPYETPCQIDLNIVSASNSTYVPSIPGSGSAGNYDFKFPF